MYVYAQVYPPVPDGVYAVEQERKRRKERGLVISLLSRWFSFFPGDYSTISTLFLSRLGTSPIALSCAYF